MKNAEGAGKDSPDTARDLILRLHARWITDAGGKVARDPKYGRRDPPRCEILPSVSYAGENVPPDADVPSRACVAVVDDFHGTR